MNEFNNWDEVTTYMFRCVVGPGACYEIIVTYWDAETPIGTAKADLYSAGWFDMDGHERRDYERELLVREQPVQHCIEVAIKDLKLHDPKLADELVTGPVNPVRDQKDYWI